MTVQTLRAKHLFAAQTNSISLNLRVQGASHEPQITAFKDAIDFGSFTPTVLPGEFRATGSPLVETDELDGAIAAIELHPDVRTPENQQVALLLRTKDDTVVARATGTARRVASGTRGLTVEQVVHSAVTLTWRLPTDPAESGAIGIEFDASKAMDAGELLEAMRLAEKLGARAVIRVADHREDSHARRPDRTFAKGDRGRGQPESSSVGGGRGPCHRSRGDRFVLPVPDSFGPFDRIWLRVFRLVLEGRMCIGPQRCTRFNLTLPPDAVRGDAMQSFLAGNSLMFVMAKQNPTLEIGDHKIQLPGELAFVMRSGCLQDAEAVRSSLERGRETPVVVGANADEHLLVYMPARTAKNGKINPQPLGLSEIHEVAELT